METSRHTGKRVREQWETVRVSEGLKRLQGPWRPREILEKETERTVGGCERQ